ncbi:MAG: glycosyltransferase family 2 protein [Lachnospiraceae bacterium]|nr:glycosyltransferase family 2 protein [Lachnospiraceae bacterium]
MYQYQVTLVIAEYNTDFGKIFRSVASALLQKNICLQIIVTDDGSQEDHFEQLSDLFKDKCFEDYIFVKSEKNIGTVNIIYKAIQQAKGKYLYCLGAGDYLYDENVLHDLYKHMEENKLDACMGRVVCYNMVSDIMSLVSVPNWPRNMQIYYTGNTILQRINYLELDDNAFGIALASRMNKAKKYFGLIKGKARFAEDMIYRVMLFDNCPFGFFDRILCWYEHGTGISTKGSKKWDEIIAKDWHRVDEVILNMHPKDWVARRYQRLLRRKKKYHYRKHPLTLWLYPEMYFLRRQARKTRENTTTDVDLDFYYKITREVSGDIARRQHGL